MLFFLLFRVLHLEFRVNECKYGDISQLKPLPAFFLYAYYLYVNSKVDVSNIYVLFIELLNYLLGAVIY